MFEKFQMDTYTGVITATVYFIFLMKERTELRMRVRQVLNRAK